MRRRRRRLEAVDQASLAAKTQISKSVITEAPRNRPRFPPSIRELKPYGSSSWVWRGKGTDVGEGDGPAGGLRLAVVGVHQLLDVHVRHHHVAAAETRALQSRSVWAKAGLDGGDAEVELLGEVVLPREHGEGWKLLSLELVNDRQCRKAYFRRRFGCGTPSGRTPGRSLGSFGTWKDDCGCGLVPSLIEMT